MDEVVDEVVDAVVVVGVGVDAVEGVIVDAVEGADVDVGAVKGAVWTILSKNWTTSWGRCWERTVPSYC